MPVATMSIKADWDAAVLAAALPAIPGVVYGSAKDNHGPLVLLKFRYAGEKMHVTMPVESGGTTSSFHITVEANSAYASGKSEGPTYIKNTKSIYFDFTVRANNQVDISAAQTIRPADSKKPIKVKSADFNATLVTQVRRFMVDFINYMRNQGHATNG